MTLTLEDYTPDTVARPTVAHVTKASPFAKKKHPYYDYGPLLSHHAEYNFLVGGRGLGKTYGAKRHVVRRNIKTGEQFIYLRRYKEELSAARDTFFADIGPEFPEWDFRNLGNEFQKSPASQSDNKRRDWETIGYAMALSKGQEKKSVALPLVRTIIFDEFIIEKGVIRYLPDEATVFNNFYSTVDRWQDKTTVFFLANAITLANPYFIKYGILPDADDEFVKLDVGKAKGFILAHFPDADAFADSVKKTRFGQFIDGDAYSDYAVGNHFADNTLALIGVKNPRSRFMFNFESKAGTFSIWHDVVINEYYVYQKTPPGQLTVTMLMERLDENKTLLLPNDLLIKQLATATRHKRVKYENQFVRAGWFEIMDGIV